MTKYILYTINTSQLFSVEGIPAGTRAPQTSSEEWYRSVWFIAVMALIAIIILFVLLACCLYRSSGGRTVYVRDREPLPPRTKIRSRPPSMSSLYTSSDRKNGSMIVSPGLCFNLRGRGYLDEYHFRLQFDRKCGIGKRKQILITSALSACTVS